MKRLKLYLETPTIIMLGPDQDPIRRAITEDFFRIVSEKPDEYELLTSPMVVRELNNAKTEEKRKLSLSFLETIKHTELPQNDEAENLAWIYVIENVLTDRHINDLTHVAYAVVARCDYVVTWNMAHLANPKIVKRVNEVNAIEKYSHIIIETPAFFTGDPTHGK